MQCDPPKHLRVRSFEELSQTLIYGEVRSPVLHNEPSFSIVKRVKDKVYCTTKQELLSIGYLLELFEEVTCLGFGPEGQVSVEFVEQNDMEAADTVSLVEA